MGDAKATGTYTCEHTVLLSGYDEGHKFPKCPYCGKGDFVEMRKLVK